MGDKNRTFQTANADAVIKPGHGILKSFYVVNGNAAYTVDLYDHCTTCMVACDGTLIASIDGALVGVNAPYVNTTFNSGLVADVTGCGGNVLVIFE